MLLDEIADAHEPILIVGPRSNAVLVGEEDWNAAQETLRLLSVPGMRESIREGIATPVEEWEKEPGFRFRGFSNSELVFENDQIARGSSFSELRIRSPKPMVCSQIRWISLMPEDTKGGAP